ncbi:PrgH/EprH family type III secretion apparatus protein [Providencia stuartii]|uniref:PrgH/EprH family type III secretion apparatus protein n=1 Tax=Providencia stuartii TaxID=588 RepID=UPI0011240CF0|nr:PrgH/EprH family type III secretion apparatus protein [Providencia stuartii]
MKSTTSRTCIMKIASGPMNGQELMLTADEHMIVIDPNVEYRAEVDEKGFTTYYIPSNSNHYELAIQTNDIDGSNDSNATFSLYINDGIKSFKTPIVYQELMLTDSFPIVFKQLDTPWELTLTDSKTADIFIEKEQKNKLINTTSKWNFIFLALFVFLLFFIIYAMKVYSTNTTVKKINTIESILQGSHHPIVVTLNKKGEALILVQTQREVDWGIQRLYKEKYQEKYTIKRIDILEKEIENKLLDYIPSILKIDLSNPCQPIIRKIKEQALAKDETIINEVMHDYLGCYKNSEFVTIKLNELLSEAEVGLAESHVPWKKIRKDQTIIYLIQGSLNDKQTSSIIQLANQFSNKWGNRHVQFSISLATNKLAGKSFISNNQGYIILDHNSWSFNPNVIN